ncbi:MAG: DsbA family protein [Candidatus Scalindua sp.]
MMEKKFTLVLVAIIVVILGIAILGKQSRDPLLKELLSQQTQMIKTQERMESQLVSSPRADTNLSGVLSKQRDLERRIAALENQLIGLQAGGVQQAKRNFRQQPKGSGTQRALNTTVYDIEVAHSPVRGKKDALVTIVAFDDYQCPFCARFHPPILEALKAYPDKVNFMIKNFPLSFHPQAKPAAKAVLAAGEQGKYFEMADAILANNRDLSDERFKQEAENLGLDVDQFMKDYKEKDAQWEDIIQKDLTLGQKVGVRGTPSFYINGKKSQSRDIGSWKREIDQILNSKPSSVPKGGQKGDQTWYKYI